MFVQWICWDCVKSFMYHFICGWFGKIWLQAKPEKRNKPCNDDECEMRDIKLATILETFGAEYRLQIFECQTLAADSRRRSVILTHLHTCTSSLLPLLLLLLLSQCKVVRNIRQAPAMTLSEREWERERKKKKTVSRAWQAADDYSGTTSDTDLLFIFNFGTIMELLKGRYRTGERKRGLHDVRVTQ